MLLMMWTHFVGRPHVFCQDHISGLLSILPCRSAKAVARRLGEGTLKLNLSLAFAIPQSATIARHQWLRESLCLGKAPSWQRPFLRPILDTACFLARIGTRTNLWWRLGLKLYDLGLLSNCILGRNIVCPFRMTHPMAVGGVFARRIALWSRRDLAWFKAIKVRLVDASAKSWACTNGGSLAGILEDLAIWQRANQVV